MQSPSALPSPTGLLDRIWNAMYRLLNPRKLNPIGWLDVTVVLGVKGDRFFFKLTFDDSRYNVTNPLFWV
jgi:hypothetical protein